MLINRAEYVRRDPMRIALEITGYDIETGLRHTPDAPK